MFHHKTNVLAFIAFPNAVAPSHFVWQVLKQDFCPNFKDRPYPHSQPFTPVILLFEFIEKWALVHGEDPS